MATNTPDPASNGLTEGSNLSDMEELLPAWDVPAAEPPTAVPLALPVNPQELAGLQSPDIPLAIPVAGDGQPAAEEVLASAATALPLACPHCAAPRIGTGPHCDNCGLIFPTETTADHATAADPPQQLKGRYQLGRPLGQRDQVKRYRGLDRGLSGSESVPVIILRGPRPPSASPEPADRETTPLVDAPASDSRQWPSVAWEDTVLTHAQHPALPAVLDRFVEGEWEYLIEEEPSGRLLWDAWDDPEATAVLRFGWLRQVAEALDRLHQAGALLEGLRPDILAVTADGQVRLNDVADLLPLPLPPDPPLRGTAYTAPELVMGGDRADARADLFGFGAMLYALYLGRELADSDFEAPGVPRACLAQFPDMHPLLGRLIAKTFCRDLSRRFPSDEAAREDRTGFTELLRTLEVCGRTLDQVRLEIASWTTTGMVRTGNEDTYTVLHAVESRQDEVADSALVLLADGMGGSEAGEVAAALAIQALRGSLIRHEPFGRLAAQPSHAPFDMNPETCRRLIEEALRDANQQVFAAARDDPARRGMGCTAEVVFVAGRHLVVGHVGDSRTYHLHDGRLDQLTCDQTLVNRLVELGTLTPEEAEQHPRRAELQQAIGGHADVEPALYQATVKPGDWVVVCSDGLSNQVTPQELQHMLEQEATSAEMAARRLVNFANIKGAMDNVTVVVIRAT
jgi:serine/threonine protein phosphatase PrpC